MRLSGVESGKPFKTQEFLLSILCDLAKLMGLEQPSPSCGVRPFLVKPRIEADGIRDAVEAFLIADRR
jgi:hypothetical protein